MQKIIVLIPSLNPNTCLFFISFVIQKNWVFRKGSAQ